MRGEDSRQTSLFVVGNIESMIAQDEPLRQDRVLIDILRRLDGDFAVLYPPTGRASIPPEQLMRAQVLMKVDSICSQWHQMRHIQYNILYCWFVGLGATDAVWDVTVFTKNRTRFLSNELSRRMLSEMVMLARDQGLIADEHLTVNGTHIQA